MAKKLLINRGKILRLNNVLIRKIQTDKFETIDKEVEIMENYIKLKGAMPIGPLIQYTSMIIDETGEVNMDIFLMRQANSFINHIEDPYKMESIIRVKNCMYVRFVGEEYNIKFAYDKINLTAYEEDIKLKGNSYTIFVDKQDENIVADIFMECIDDD